MLLLLPLVYLVLTAARLQSAAFSASLAGREAGRAFVTGANDADAGARARSAAALAFEDFAFTTEEPPSGWPATAPRACARTGP